jgi:hypothetical protein
MAQKHERGAGLEVMRELMPILIAQGRRAVLRAGDPSREATRDPFVR